MNKKTITLISIITLLASLQLACSFSDMLGNLGQENGQPVSQSNSLQRSHPSQDGDEEQDPAQDELEQENPNPTATPSGCVNSFTGSSNIPDGSEYQAGDAVETSLTLTNTGTCSWNSAYSLSVVGGDLIPSSEDLPVVALVAPGESIMVGVEFSTCPGWRISVCLEDGKWRWRYLWDGYSPGCPAAHQDPGHFLRKSAANSQPHSIPSGIRRPVHHARWRMFRLQQ